MRNLPFVIGVPTVMLSLLIAAVFAWRISEQSAPVMPTRDEVMVLQEGEGRPSSSFDDARVVQIAPISQDAEVASLEQELQATIDDGGAAEFESLEAEAAAL